MDAGWVDESQLETVLAKARELESRGVDDRAYLLKLLIRAFPLPETEPLLRDEPLKLAEAIAPKTDQEHENLDVVRRHLRDYLRLQVITGAAIMPDACPVGKEASVPVGGVIAAEGAIFPAAHSSDICCSMFATFYHADQSVEAMLDAVVASTRFGPGSRGPEDRIPHPVVDEDVWYNPFLKGLEEKARAHIADQGDGNHFAFVGRVRWSTDQLRRLAGAGYGSIAERLKPEPEMLALVTHHGSRGLGASVFTRGMAAAVKQSAKRTKGVPDAMAWLDAESEAGEAYWDALQYVGRWTRANHTTIHDRFLDSLKAQALTSFGNEHNFVWKRGKTFLHGKGATPAWRDDSGRPLLGLIPLNMASPILVVLGKDNADFLSFAPHGAGRNMSRRAAMKPFRLKGGGIDIERVGKAIAQSTAGLDVRWYCGKADFTETPSAYKNAASIHRQIEQFGLADIVGEIEPLGCVMAGETKRRKEEELTPKQIRQIQHRAERRKLRQNLHHGERQEE